jgi:hypothetical protein
MARGKSPIQGIPIFGGREFRFGTAAVPGSGSEPGVGLSDCGDILRR